MSESCLEGVLSGPRLPTLPAVAVQVIRLSESPDASISQIAAAIEFDQALVVRLLRTVNSSYYGLQRECGSVAQAMSFLGLRAVRSLVLGFSMAKTLDGGGDTDIDFPWRPYWRRAVRTAAGARILSRFVKGVDADEAQVAGLVCDVGMVALYRAFSDRYLQILDAAQKDESRLVAEERRSLDVDHAEVGRRMAERWRFPDALIESIARHEQEPTAESPALARVTAWASMAQRAIGEVDPSTRARAEAAFFAAADRALSVARPQATKALESIAQRAFELAAILELDISTPHDHEKLVDRAEELRGPVTGDGTRGPVEAAEPDGFEGRLAAAFEHAAGVGGAAVAVIEPDGCGHAGHRPRRDDLAMSRLEATITERLGGLASLHRISPSLIALVFEISPTNDGEKGTLRVIERLRRDVENMRLPRGDGASMTISVGVALQGTRRFESPDALLRAAMLALAAAQRGGRNRVGHFKPSYDPMAS